MHSQQESFEPGQIDEQIERLSQQSAEQNPDTQIVQQLQQHFQRKKRETTLNQAWERINQKYEEVNRPTLHSISQTRQETARMGINRMNSKALPTDHKNKKTTLWSTLLAVAVLALLIGSTAIFMARANQSKGDTHVGGGGPAVPECVVATPSPTPITQVGNTMITPTPIATPIATQTPQKDCVTPIPTPKQPATPTPVGTPIPPPAKTPTAVPVTPTSVGTPTAVPVTPTSVGTPTPIPNK